MADPVNLPREDWEALLQAPLGVYAAVAAAGGEATAAQFRRLREELAGAEGSFAAGSTGRLMVESVSANLDLLWEAQQVAGRTPADVVKRAVRALGRVPREESEAIRDWLAVLAVRIAEADRVVGEGPLTWDELDAIRALAGWLRRPVPRIGQG